MKRIILYLFIFSLSINQSNAQVKKLSIETALQKKERMAWWVNDRFGMFIHWGIYALPARHEWVKNYESISDADYQKYFDNFNPDLYNPREWAKMAKAAGMKYAVLTTKHHDGFCLFDSKFTDFKSTKTPYGKDLLKEWVDAFRAEGLKVGFYYSLLDWHHPDFTVDKIHPLGKNDVSKIPSLNQGRDMAKYREYMLNQIRELLTNYGKIDILWMDFSYPGENGKGRLDWGSEKLLSLVRQLQPGILVNNRLDLNEFTDGWDINSDAEQVKNKKGIEMNGEKVPWETCQTFSGSWGYFRDEHTWKSNKQLLVTLIDAVSKGGNVILNVGPTARGTIDERAQKGLAGIGEWMKYNSRSIYGCTEAPEGFSVPENCILTYNPKTNRLYIHMLDYPVSTLALVGYNGKVKYAQFLHDGSEIKYSTIYGWGGNAKETPHDLNLTLPVSKPNVEVPVIELILN